MIKNSAGENQKETFDSKFDRCYQGSFVVVSGFMKEEKREGDTFGRISSMLRTKVEVESSFPFSFPVSYINYPRTLRVEHHICCGVLFV